MVDRLRFHARTVSHMEVDENHRCWCCLLPLHPRAPPPPQPPWMDTLPHGSAPASVALSQDAQLTEYVWQSPEMTDLLLESAKRSVRRRRKRKLQRFDRFITKWDRLIPFTFDDNVRECTRVFGWTRLGGVRRFARNSVH